MYMRPLLALRSYTLDLGGQVWHTFHMPMPKNKLEFVSATPEVSKADVEELEQKRKTLTTRHLDLMQEEVDLPEKIRPIVLRLNEHPMGTEEGDRLRAELDVMEGRLRTIHLPIQENLKELKECNATLEEAQQLSEKTGRTDKAA